MRVGVIGHGSSDRVVVVVVVVVKVIVVVGH